MKLMMRLKSKSVTIYSKLVVGFLLAVVPMYAAGLSISESGMESVRREILQSIATRTQFFMQTFEQEMRGTVTLLKELSLDDDILKLSTIAPAMSPFERSQAFNRLQSKLRLLQNSNRYIDVAMAYIPLIDKTVKGMSYSEAMDDGQVEALRMASTKHDSAITVWEGKLLIGQTYPFWADKGKPLTFAICVELSVPHIQKALAEMTNGSGGGAALIGMGENWYVANWSEAETGLRIIGEIASNVHENHVQSFQDRIEIDGQSYWFSVEKSQMLNAMLVLYVPEDGFVGKQNKYRVLFWALSCFSLFVIIVFSYWIYNRIHQPLRRMVRAFRKVDYGNLQVEIHHHHNDEFHYLYEQFNAMVKRLQVLIHEVYEQKIRSQRSELKQLQSQINPHFLYNSFFTLHQMAQMHDYENIVRFTKHLGNYFRFITRNASDEVDIAVETAHARTYTEIQTIRFGNRITVAWDPIPEGCEHVKVPVLILQPLIENAYEHGLADKESGGRIEIRMSRRPDSLHITVEDNGESLTEELLNELRRKLSHPDQFHETTGLFNVHRRLRLKFGPSSGLMLSRGVMGGLQIDIEIPLGEDGKDVSSVDCG